MPNSANTVQQAGFPFTGILANIVRGGILAALLTPLFLSADHYFPYSSPKGFWLMAAVQITFAAWVILTCLEQKYRPQANAITLGLLVCLVFESVSALLGLDPARSLWSTYERMSGVMLHLHLFAFFLVLASFLKTERDWRQLFVVSSAVAAVVSLFGIAHALGFGSSDSEFPIFRHYLSPALNSGSTLGNTSFMGSYLLINAFFALYLFQTTQKRTKMLSAVLVILLVSGIALNSGGRAMKISLIAGVALMVILSLAVSPQFREKRKLARTLAIAIPGFVLLFLVVSFIFREAIGSRIMGIEGVSDRLAVWSIAWNGFLERPILGWGLENFDLVYFKNFDPSLIVGQGLKTQDRWFDRAHNATLDVLVSGGIVGLVSHYFVPLASIFYLWKAGIKNGVEGTRTAILFTTMLGAHFLQNLSVFDTVSTQMLIVATFAFASQSAPSISIPIPNLSKIHPSLPKAVIATSAVILSFLLFWKTVYIPAKISREITPLSSSPLEAPLLEKYRDITDSATIGRREILVKLSEVAAKRLENLAGARTSGSVFEEAEFILAQLETNSEKFPMNFRLPFESGQLNSNAALGKSEGYGPDSDEAVALDYAVQAESAFREAIEISPDHVLAHLGLARALIYQGFIAEDEQYHSAAFAAVEKAMEIEPELYESRQMAIDIAHDLLADDDLTSQLVEQGERIDPQWKPRLLRRVRER